MEDKNVSNDPGQFLKKIKNALKDIQLPEDKILVSEEMPLQKWCTLLDCEECDLLKALSIMGDSVRMVNDYLILNRQKKS